MEPTTKKWGKLKVKTDKLRSIGTVQGFRGVSPEEETGGGYGGKDLQKRRF